MENRNRFLLRNREKEEFNQYWYSSATIQVMANEVEINGGNAAFLSTPSIYFTLSDDVRKTCSLWDLDSQWSKEPDFYCYDFNKYEEIPAEYRQKFDMVVIDPPFITRDVWEKYTLAVKAILKPGGKIIATTIAENESMMLELLDVTPQRFKPSIPNLVYQYCLYTNYESDHLSQPNSEIPEY